MEMWQVILLILAGVVSLYILVGIVVFTFTLAFKYKVEKRQDSISLLVSQKYDMLMGIVEELENLKVIVPESILHNIKGKRDIDFLAYSKIDRDHLLASYHQANYQIKLIAEQNNVATKSEKYRLLSASFDEIDELYRSNIAIYNSDVTGYNYWVSFKGYRHLLRLFNLNKKEILL